jgi:ectoine hydroxylase-related dioxygenase (phytanoyl-CoA dioxygenase family)
MPNHFKFAAKAGDCIVFDIASWHSAMPNHTDLEREAVIIGFKNGSHVGRATARTGGMPSPELLKKLDAKGVLSDEHKQLLREVYAP